MKRYNSRVTNARWTQEPKEDENLVITAHSQRRHNLANRYSLGHIRISPLLSAGICLIRVSACPDYNKDEVEQLG